MSDEILAHLEEFKVLDLNADGLLEKKEILSSIRKEDEDIEIEDADAFIEDLDISGDGLVSWSEYYTSLISQEIEVEL